MQGVELTDPAFLGQKRVFSGLGAVLHVGLLSQSLPFSIYQGRMYSGTVPGFPPNALRNHV